MNLASIIERSAFYFPERPALSDGERELSYRELNLEANRVATGLIELGLNPGRPGRTLRPQLAGMDHLLFRHP